MVVIGVDCGVHGAIAAMSGSGVLLAVADMPTVSVRVGKSQRDRINASALAHLIRDWEPSHAAIERIAPRPTDTPMTAGYLMQAAGVVEGVLCALGIPTTMVETSAWRKAAGIKLAPDMDYRARKEASRVRAIQLFPLQHALFARKGDSDRAEAALVAHWLVQRERGR